jgi:hypothetical protein
MKQIVKVMAPSLPLYARSESTCLNLTNVREDIDSATSTWLNLSRFNVRTPHHASFSGSASFAGIANSTSITEFSANSKKP